MTGQTSMCGLAPILNPAGGESSIYLHSGTLIHLPCDTFAVVAKLAADLEIQSPGIFRKIADAVGCDDGFAKGAARTNPHG